MKKLLLYIFLSFLFVNVIDPTNTIFKMKYFLFAGFIIVSTIYLLKTKDIFKIEEDLLFLMILSVIIPIYGIFIGFVRLYNDYSIAIPFIYLILVFFIVKINFNTNLYRKFMFIISIVALVNILVLVVLIYFPTNFIEFKRFFDEHQNVVMFARRDMFGQEVYMIYHKASSLLIFPLLYFCYHFINHKKVFNFIFICLILFGIILSGTRANILVSLFGILLLQFHFLLINKKYIKIALMSLSAIIGFVYFFSNLGLAFDANEAGNHIKLMHIESILYSMESNSMISILFGQGIGSLYFDIYSHGLVSLTEVTYFEMFRIFGIFGLLLFFILLILIPFYFFRNIANLKSKPYLYYAYFLYLLIASSNPLLFSTTGMIVIVIVYSEIFKYKYIKKRYFFAIKR